MKALFSLIAVAFAMYWAYSESQRANQLQVELDQTKAALMEAQQHLVGVQQQTAKKTNNSWMWSANSTLNAPPIKH